MGVAFSRLCALFVRSSVSWVVLLVFVLCWAGVSGEGYSACRSIVWFSNEVCEVSEAAPFYGGG